MILMVKQRCWIKKKINWSKKKAKRVLLKRRLVRNGLLPDVGFAHVSALTNHQQAIKERVQSRRILIRKLLRHRYFYPMGGKIEGSTTLREHVIHPYTNPRRIRDGLKQHYGEGSAPSESTIRADMKVLGYEPHRIRRAWPHLAQG